MAKHTIKRSDVVRLVGDCGLIEVFDEAVRRQGVTDGVLVYPEGWTDKDTLRVMRRSPRALWLMSRAGLIPVSEKNALRFIVEAGMTFDRIRPKTARVRTVPNGTTGALMLRATGMLGPRRSSRSGSASIPEAPLPDEFDSTAV
jgi:hypothetical protein